MAKNPTPKPVISRPTMSIATWAAAACRAPPIYMFTCSFQKHQEQRRCLTYQDKDTTKHGCSFPSPEVRGLSRCKAAKEPPGLHDCNNSPERGGGRTELQKELFLGNGRSHDAAVVAEEES